MPMTGWFGAHAVYSGKFNVHISLVEFKKKTSNILTSQIGKRYTNQDFKYEASKDIQNYSGGEYFIRSQSLQRNKENMPRIYLRSYYCRSGQGRTKKENTHWEDKSPMYELSKAIGEFADTTLVKYVKNLIIIQVAQIAYQRTIMKAN